VILKKTVKILIVDDEAYIRRVLELKLRNKGYEVFAAANGAEGLEKLNLYEPEVVITDIKMPGMDGRALCEKINNSNNDKPYLIIVVTCSVSDGNLRWINNMRDTLLLEKPFSPSRVLEAIEDYVESTDAKKR
jgi:CheY-like chemotaxis protein